jgi:endonuclease YncB( thermonuclease family)
MRRLVSIFLAVIALLLLGQSATTTLTGRVERVLDGDTVVFLDSTNTRRHVRLDGIDAPESVQLKGKESADRLKALVLDKNVTVVSSGLDKYGRTIGRIYLGNKWVNLEMVKEGLAWHYKQYSKDIDLAAAEVTAREKKIGVWADPESVAPWEFRRIAKLPPPVVDDLKPVAEMVYVTRAGRSYHREDCIHLGRRSYPIDLQQAKNRYSPCLTCKPPK